MGAASTDFWKNLPVRKLMSAANSTMKATESQRGLLTVLKDACRDAAQDTTVPYLWGEWGAIELPPLYNLELKECCGLPTF